MREILFRGRSISGDWYYGDLSVLKKDYGNIKAGTYISNSAGFPFAYSADPSTVGQYIGLNDKNGNKIFAGDKVTWMSYSGSKLSGVVKWGGYELFKSFIPCWVANYRGGGIVLTVKSLKSLAVDETMEITGNIHEPKKDLKND